MVAGFSQNQKTGGCGSSYGSGEEGDLAVVENEGSLGTNLTVGGTSGSS